MIDTNQLDKLLNNHQLRMRKLFIKEYFDLLDSKERFPHLREFNEYTLITAVIKKELLEANCTLYFDRNRRSVENIRGKVIDCCSFSRISTTYYTAVFNVEVENKLGEEFINKLIKEFYKQYSGENGFGMDRGIYNCDDNSLYSVDIFNQWTLNRFTKFLCEQENYIKMNLL